MMARNNPVLALALTYHGVFVDGSINVASPRLMKNVMDLYAHIDYHRRGLLAGRSRRSKDGSGNNASSADGAPPLPPSLVVIGEILRRRAIHWTRHDGCC